ncbi:MAG TPA: hypothetical protein VJT81_06740 [Burkholderiales bacterium]|nr:hypothetical protein [Burkholderiales bacterium]
MTKGTLPALLALATLFGCASFNDSMTPSVQTIKDDFDGSQIVRQEPVSAASSLNEAWHTLGFEWRTNNPDVVIITAGVNGIVNISTVAFNADDRIIDKFTEASRFTDHGTPGDYAPPGSTRRFAMSWDDFLTIAHAKSVKMRLSQIDAYSVSSFGPSHAGATVNTKFAPFLDKVRALRSPAQKT